MFNPPNYIINYIIQQILEFNNSFLYFAYSIDLAILKWYNKVDEM